MAKRTFEMNGNQYTSLMAIARELGVKRVYAKDFDKYGITEIGAQDDTTADDTQVVEPEAAVETTETAQEDKPEKKASKKSDKKADKPETKKAETKKAAKANKDDKKADEPKVDKRFTRKLGTPEQIKEVEDNIKSLSLEQFTTSVRHFTVDALATLAEDAGIDTQDGIANEPIRRMRLLMGLKAFYYPNEKTPVKAASEWKKIALEDLVALAADKKVEYKGSDDDKIQRMRVIVALKAAGLTPNDVPQKAENTTDKVEANA